MMDDLITGLLQQAGQTDAPDNGPVDPQLIIDRMTRKGLQPPQPPAPKSTDFGAGDEIVQPKPAKPAKAAKPDTSFGADDEVVTPTKTPLPRPRPAQAPQVPQEQPLTAGQEFGAFGKGLVQGGVNSAGAIAKGAGALYQGNGAPAQGETPQVDVMGNPTGFNNPATPAIPVTPFEDRSFVKAGNAIEGEADNLAPMTPQEKASIGGQAGQLVGGVAPYVAIGLVNPTLAFGAGAVGMGLSTAGQTYEQAKAKGASDEDAARASGLSAAIGATLGVLPLGVVMKPIQQASPGIVGYAAAKLAQAAQSGITFATVGEAQEYLLQKVAQEFYDPKAGYSPDAKRVIANLLGGGLLGTLHPVIKPDDISSPEAIADFLKKAKGAPQPPPEGQSFGTERGAQWRSEIDDFLRQQEQQQQMQRPGLPGPEGEPPPPEATPQSPEEPPPTAPSAPTGEAAPKALPKPADTFGEEDHAVGTRNAPANVISLPDLSHAIARAAEDYTPAQGEANNRQLGHAKWNGLDISIETPAGGIRKGLNPQTGEPWQTTMGAAYGYIRGTKGADGMQVDIFMGDHPESKTAYVIDENDAATGRFRQHKIMAGFDTEDAARAAYLGTSSKSEQTLGAITPMSVPELKTWLKGDTTKPVVQTKAIAAPGAPKPSTEPLSLMQFIASKGGLRPDPELSAMDLSGKDRVQIPGKKGFFSVVRPTGMSLDQMREAAQEAGYFPAEHPNAPPTNSVRDFLNAIDNETRGKRLQRQGEEGLPTKRDEERIDEENAFHQQELEANRRDIEEMSKANGIPPELLNEQDVRLATEIMHREGLSADEALERAAMQNLEASNEVTPEEVDDSFGFGAFDAVQPSPAHENVAPAPEQGGEHERPAEEGGPAQPGHDVSGAGESREEPVERPAAEEPAEPAERREPEPAAEFGHGDERVAEPETVESFLDHVESEIAAGKHDADIAPTRSIKEFNSATRARGWISAPYGKGRALWSADRKHVMFVHAPIEGNQLNVQWSAPSEGIKPPPTTEQTEVGKQTVLPGAEKIGQGELAQRKANERLKPKAEQKPMDEGLFGDDSKQVDLLDLTRNTEPRKSGFTSSKMKELLDEEMEQVIGMWHRVHEPVSEGASDFYKSVTNKMAKQLDELGVLRLSSEQAVRDALMDRRMAGETVKATGAEESGEPEVFSLRLGEGEPAPVPKVTLEQRRRIEQALDALIRKMVGPNIQTRFADRINLKAPVKGWGGYGEGVETAAGSYVPAEHLINIAMADPKYPLNQTLDTVFHESFHAIENRLLTDQEMQVMKREDARLREIVQHAFGFKPEEVRDFAGYEVRALAFEAYAAGRTSGTPPSGFHIAIRRAFERLLQLFREIRNYLNGLGFQSADQIFERAYEGDFAERAGNRSEGQEQFSIRRPARPVTPRKTIADRIADLFPDKTRADLAETLSNYSHREMLLQKEVEARFFRLTPEEVKQRFPAASQLPDAMQFYNQKELMPGKMVNETNAFRKELLTPLIEHANKNKLSLPEIGDYLLAKGAIERNEMVSRLYEPGHAFNDAVNNPDIPGGSGLSANSARAAIQRFETGPKGEAFKELWKQTRKIVAFNRKLMVDYGLETQGTVDSWGKDYVPYRSWEEIPEDAPEPRGRGWSLGVRGPETQTAFGRTSKADNPLVHLIEQTYRTIERGEMNEHYNSIGLALATLKSQGADISDIATLNKGRPKKIIDPNTGLARIVEDSRDAFNPNAVNFKRNGNPYFIVFKSRKVAESVKRASPWSLGLLRYALLGVNKLKALWTHYSPDFAARHFFGRYMVEGVLNAYQLRDTGKYSPARWIADAFPGLGKASKAIFARERGVEAGQLGQYWDEMKAHGGPQAFRAMRDIDSIKNELTRDLRDLTGKPHLSALQTWRRVTENIDRVFNVWDNATRLATYAQARDQGMSPQKAAYIARNATINYQKRGLISNAAGLFLPFFNTAIQTGTRMSSAAAQSPRMRRVIASVFAAGVGLALWNYLVGGDDDDGTPYFEKIPPWERALSMIVLNPFERDAKGRPQKYALPFPYNYALPLSFGYHMTGMLLSGAGVIKHSTVSAAEHLAEMAKSTLMAFSPLGETGNPIDIITPEILKPLAHIAENQTWTGAPVHRDKTYQRGSNASYGFETTGQGWKSAAEWINFLTGGSKYRSGYIDPHPEDIRELGDQLFGSQKRFGIEVANTSAAILNGTAPKDSDVPVLKVFRGADYDAADRFTFNKERQDLRHRMDAVRQAAKDKQAGVNVEEADKTLSDAEAEGIRVVQGKKGPTVKSAQDEIYKRADKQMKQLRALEKAAQDDKTMTSTQRDQAVSDIHEQMRGVQEGARRQYRLLKEPAL